MPQGPESKRKIPEIEIDGDVFSVVKRGANVRTLAKIADDGTISVIRSELARPEEITPEEAEAEYINSSLILLRAMAQSMGTRMYTDTEVVGPDLELLDAQTRFENALRALLDHRFPWEIHGINARMRTQINDLGLQHIGEGTTRARGDVPILDRAVRDEVRKREQEERQLGL